MNVALSSEAALPFIAWSRIWSPMVPEELRQEAWEALLLPHPYHDWKTEFWSTFHIGNPIPKIPLLFHAALNMQGDHARQDWLRVMEYLGLRWQDIHLPPDQLGAACEVYAYAIEREEAMLIRELRQRYLIPWCEFAKSQLQGEHSPLLFLPESFEQDLQEVRSEP